MFGDFGSLCTTVPSYPWCNLFYAQAIRNGYAILFKSASANPDSAPVGINPDCAIPRLGHSYPGSDQSSLGNIANIIASGLSVIVALFFLWRVSRRHAAVGRIELSLFLLMYALVCALQLFDTGSFLEQGALPITILTSIHAGAVAALFWGLLANGLVTTQIVEDGTMQSLVPYFIFTLAFFAATTYTALDTGLSFTSRFGPSNPPLNLGSIPLFALVIIWPLVAGLIALILYSYTVLAVLHEPRPFALYTLSAVLFILGELAGFLLSKVICNGSGSKIDGSFVTTVLNTMAVVSFVSAWRLITEEDWDEEEQYY